MKKIIIAVLFLCLLIPSVSFGADAKASADATVVPAAADLILGLQGGTANKNYAWGDNLISLKGLTFADASIIQLTGAGAAAVLTSGGNNYILGSNSDNSALEFKTPANVLSQIGAQANLSLVKGTLTNTYLCTYTTAGTLLDCNTNPASFMPSTWIVQAGANNILTYTGNYTFGVTLTGNTSVTLPTSGTLATTAGTLASTVLDDTKGNGDTAFVWSADKVFDLLAGKSASDHNHTGTYIPVGDIALGSGTSGNYVASATANGGLSMTGTEGGSLGITPCTGNENYIMKWNDATGWTCQADANSGGTPTAITVADTTDTTSYVALFESATGDLGPKTDAGITYNAGTGMLTVTGITAGTGGVTISKQSGVAGRASRYEANSTDTDYVGEIGPASMTANTSYLLTDISAKASSANMVKACTNAGESGTGTPADPYIQACAWADLDDYAAVNSPTFTDDITIHATGVKVTGDGDGAITFLGLGDGSDEDLTLNFDDVSNEVGVSSSTGVTKVNMGSIGLASTGSFQGAVAINSDANGMSSSEMTAVGLYNTMFFATGAGTWALPTAAAGMNFCVYSTTAAAIVINPDDADDITLNGTLLADGDSITSASGAGDFICLIAIDATHWYTMGRSGTWTDTN